jgi:two-component system OmpR family response regulator
MTDPMVVVLEDDAEMRSLLLRGLREEGFAVEGVGTGSQLLQRSDLDAPDAFVIDIGLPDADGRDVCQALRARGLQTPVLFLTARTNLPDRLSGFSAGGDDYLTKPFAFAELVARLQALVRRGGGERAQVVADLRLDPAAHAAFCGAESALLTPTEYRLLARLAAAPGETVRRRALIQAAWPYGAMVHANTLDAYVARLRHKLASLSCAPTITTVRGVGYSLGGSPPAAGVAGSDSCG